MMQPLLGTPEAFTQDDEELNGVLDEIRAVMLATPYTRRFRTQVARQVLTAARDEIRRLVEPSQVYRQSIRRDEEFMRRFGPMCDEASQLIDVSIDECSTWCAAQDSRSRADDCVSRQPDNTIRLFVFSSIQNALRHRSVLAAHHARYGTSGAVLLTSIGRYKQWLEEIDVSHAQELHERSLSILVFDGGAAGGSGGKEYYEATRSRTDVTLRQIRNVAPPYESLIDTLSRLKTTTLPGESELGILKWHEDFRDSDDAWSTALSKLFDSSGETRASLVYHVVFIKPSSNQKNVTARVGDLVQSTLLGLVSKKTGERLVEELWFGSRSQPLDGLTVVDGQYGGPIRISNELTRDYPLCIVVTLRTVEALREYYEDHVHSRVRRELLSLCNPKIASMYKILDMPERLSDEERRLIYDAIETTASSTILRADFTVESACGIGSIEASGTPIIRGKRCAACDRPFACSGDGCWCHAVSLASATRARLSSEYDDCLCPECLQQQAGQDPP